MSNIGEKSHQDTKCGPRLTGGVRRYSPLRRLDLPDPARSDGVGIWDVIRERRSKRDYSGESISLRDLSQLLWATQGITGGYMGYGLRAAPSAGALYPIDTYVVVNRVGSLSPGLYLYDPGNHAVDLLLEAELGRELSSAALGQYMCEEAAVVFIWVAVAERSRRKYRERAYRYIYMDAGHIAQNLYLAATALGLGCCAIGAFYDDEVNRIVGADGVEEFAVYMVSVGAV